MPSIANKEMQKTQTKTVTLPVDVAHKAADAIERLLMCPVNVPEDDMPALQDIADRLNKTPINIIF